MFSPWCGKCFTIFSVLLLVSLTSKSRGVHHWKLESNGTIQAVENSPDPVDPVFILLNNSGKERLTELTPATLPIPHSQYYTGDEHNDFSDALWPSTDADGEEDEAPLPDAIAQDSSVTGGSNNMTSLVDSTVSTFLLQHQRLSLLEDVAPSEYPPTDRGNILLNGLASDADANDSTRIYSELNTSSLLTCSPPVSHTRYDVLEALKARHKYPIRQELEVAVIFKKPNSNIINLTAVELELQHTLADESPASIALLNELGNFWRVQGNTLEAVECFRWALHQQPDNADVLLNLARLLLNLDFVQDARTLAYRSLAVASPEQNSWLQHFTLADTYGRSGAQEETMRELSHTLDLNPGFKPAEVLLSHLKRKHTPGPEDDYMLSTVTVIVLLSGSVLVLLYWLLIRKPRVCALNKLLGSSAGEAADLAVLSPSPTDSTTAAGRSQSSPAPSHNIASGMLTSTENAAEKCVIAGRLSPEASAGEGHIMRQRRTSLPGAAAR